MGSADDVLRDCLRSGVGVKVLDSPVVDVGCAGLR